MSIRTWAMLIFGLGLLVATVLWSTGRIDLPGPFATLRAVPQAGESDLTGKLVLLPGPDRGREFRDQLLASIWQDRMITITIHVALCDSSKSKVKNPIQGRGNDFRDNLYWGARHGVEGFFRRQSEWTVRHAELRGSVRYILRRLVLTRRVEPTPEWRQRGVTEPFEIGMLAIAWSGPAAADAMRAALMDASGLQRRPRIIPVGDRKLRFGSGSNLVGYLGYNALRDDPSIPPDMAEPLDESVTRGVFFISPSSAESVGTVLQQLGMHPVLLTTGSITPGAYILYGLTEALAAGKLDGGFGDQAAKEYAKYHRLIPKGARRLFVP